MEQLPEESSKSLLDFVPPIVWPLLLVVGVGAAIVGIVVFIWGLATVEGFGSALMLIGGGYFLFYNATRPNREKIKNDDVMSKSRNGPGLYNAFMVVFFALVGALVDQPGNVIYNEPVEWILCPAGSTLHRDIDVVQYSKTSINQDFTCVKDGQVVREIFWLVASGVRFVEYIFIGYAVIYLSRIYAFLRRRLIETEEPYIGA